MGFFFRSVGVRKVTNQKSCREPPSPSSCPAPSASAGCLYYRLSAVVLRSILLALVSCGGKAANDQQQHLFHMQMFFPLNCMTKADIQSLRAISMWQNLLVIHSLLEMIFLLTSQGFMLVAVPNPVSSALQSIFREGQFVALMSSRCHLNEPQFTERLE